MKKKSVRATKPLAKTSVKTTSKTTPKTSSPSLSLTPIWAALVVLVLVLGAKYTYFVSRRQSSSINYSATQTTTSLAGNYTAALPAASSPGRLITLQLNADGQALLNEDYQDGQPVIVETGAWDQTPDGKITTIFGSQTITFTLDGTTLTAVAYDLDLWGSDGLTLTKV